MKTKFIVSFVVVFFLVAFALPVFADNGTSTNEKKESKDLFKKDVNTGCMIAAIGKRDSAIATAFGVYTNGVTSALTARTASLKSAWGQTDRKIRRNSLSSSWKTYRDGVQKIQKTWKDSKKSAWGQFNADRKACGPAASSDDDTGQSVDALI